MMSEVLLANMPQLMARIAHSEQLVELSKPQESLVTTSRKTRRRQNTINWYYVGVCNLYHGHIVPRTEGHGLPTELQYSLYYSMARVDEMEGMHHAELKTMTRAGPSCGIALTITR